VRRWKIVTVVAAVIIITVSGAAYATGSIPERLMSQALVNDAWIAANCTGPIRDRPTLCPNPGEDPPASLPAGPNGSMVAFGDSYSAGEGAPVSAFAIHCTRDTRGQFSSPDRCGKPGEKPHGWGPVSGYYPGSDTNDNVCHRSPAAYAPRVARDLGLSLDFRACSGAVSGDYWTTRDKLPGGTQEAADDWNHEPDGTPLAPQKVAPLPPDTKLVTVGFGGNNAHFSDLVTACILTSMSARGIPASIPVVGMWYNAAVGYVKANDIRDIAGDAWRNDTCAPFAEKLRLELPTLVGEGRPDQPMSVEGVYRDVRASAPKDARVLVIGYPRVFPTEPTGSCGMGTGEAIMDAAEQRAINLFVSELNRYLRQAATAAGVEYVDIESAYVAPGVATNSNDDHGLCRESDGDRWITRWRAEDRHADHAAMMGSGHPTPAGQLAAAEAMLRCYRDETTCGNYVELKAARLAGQWKTLSYPHADCPSREEWSRDYPAQLWDEAATTYSLGDYTGDGFAEVVVDITCPSMTSAWPQVSVVWDIRSREPQHLLTIDDYYWRGATLRRDVPNDIGSAAIDAPGAVKLPAPGGRIVMEGPAVGEMDAFCCPTNWARAVYDWNGREFSLAHRAIVHNATSEGDEPSPVYLGYFTQPDGKYHGIIRGWGDDTVVVDFIDIFLGASAQEACSLEGVTPQPEIGLCTDFFVNNPNQILGTVEVASDAQWLLPRGEDFNSQSVEVPDLGDLEELGLTGVEWPYFAITIKGGKAVSLEQVVFLS
jgi:hypothetical protein